MCRRPGGGQLLGCAAAGLLLLLLAGVSRAADCNQNGLDDVLDIAEGRSPDCDENDIPDECDLAGPSIEFVPSGSFDVGPSSDSLTVADVDGDGVLDLIAAPAFSFTLSILHGLGDGRFGVRIAVPLGIDRAGTSVADLNEDGRTDIVAAGGDGIVLLLQGPRGDFEEPRSLPADGLLAVSPVVEDLDGDLLPDLATGDFDRKGAIVFWNLGGGDFTPFELFPVPEAPVLSASADLDADGDPDLAITTQRSTISLLENRGERRFVAWANFPVPSRAEWIGAGDLDSDRDADLLVKTDDDLLAFLSDGNGSFTGVTWTFPFDGGCVLGDFEGDGLLDLAVIDDGLTLLPGDGGGGFRRPRWFDLGAAGLPAGAGDLDGDADLDIVASSEPGHVRAFMNTVVAQPPSDCNSNGVLDRCELAGNDDDANRVPDDCDPDCNGNGIPDGAELQGEDCDANGVLDECQLEASDCDANGVVDGCGIEARPWDDCNRNGRLDTCEVASGAVPDCDSNGVPDECDLVGIPDASAPLHFSLGNSLFSAAAADLDGDGWSDVVTVDLDSERIWIVFAARRGIAARLQYIALSERASAVGAADLDRDADVDLFFVGERSISVVFNDDDGRFTVGSGSLGVGSDIQVAEAADVDGDGDMDLIAVASASSEVWVFLNDGRGSFGAPSGFAGTPDMQAVAPGDLDDDGDIDVAAVSYESSGAVFSGRLTLLSNDGAGRFPDMTSHTLGGGSSRLSLGDVDADGDPDVAVAVASPGAVSLFSNDGGQFAATADVRMAGELRPMNVLIEDLDSDGAPDLAANWYDTTTSVHWNDGSGRFGSPWVASIFNPLGLAALDFDADGVMDIAVVGQRGLAVHLNGGGRGLVKAREISAQNEVRAHALADLDGDGDLDLVAGYDFDGNRDVLAIAHFNNGTGAFPLRRTVLLGGTMEHLAAADFDGDGDIDLATTEEYRRCDDFCETPTTSDDCDAHCSASAVVKYNDVSVSLNRGDRSFEPPVFTSVGGGGAALAASDLDGDGFGDLVVTKRLAHRIAVLHGRGGGAFEWVQSVVAPDDTFALAAGDLDGDGLPEIVAQSGAQAVTVFPSGGDGLHAPGRVYPTSGTAFAFGDADGDGDTDIVTTAGVLLNRGDGSLLAESLHPALGPLGFECLEGADMDADGDLDFVTIEAWRGRVTILANAGDARLLFESGYAIAQDGKAARIGDISGDGLPDIVISHRNSAMLTVIHGRPQILPAADCNWNGAPDECDLASGSSTDGDGDGRPDECNRPFFHRGDSNDDGRTDVSDAIALLDFLFVGRAESGCRESSDVNNDGAVNITDPLFLLTFLFSDTRAPPAPGPAWMPCGPDPDVPEGPGDLGCTTYGGC